jgi:hypothetical protein
MNAPSGNGFRCEFSRLSLFLTKEVKREAQAGSFAYTLLLRSIFVACSTSHYERGSHNIFASQLEEDSNYGPFHRL